MKRAASEESEQTTPGTIADVHYDFTQFGLDKSQSPLALNLRTSLIVDPPDGHLPPMTEEGKRLNAARAEARKRAGAITDAAQNQSFMVRCILMDRNGPPMLAGAYNNNYQIVQSANTVMILVEMLHDPRIIPTDGRPALPSSIRQLEGSSRGRWEGDTLVIETTNFTDQTSIGGGNGNGLRHSADLKLTEKIYRVDGDELRYEVHIDDPKTYVRPWTLSLPLTSPPGYVLLPYECHEGNYMLKNSLSAERAEDKAIEEDARKGIVRRRKSVQQNLDAGARPIPGRANPDDQE